jgi:hypothetical protein
MELTKQAVEQIQNACNPAGVAYQLAEWTATVQRDVGTSAATTSPLLRAIVGKLCDMYGIDHDAKYTYEALG